MRKKREWNHQTRNAKICILVAKKKKLKLLSTKYNWFAYTCLGTYRVKNLKLLSFVWKVFQKKFNRKQKCRDTRHSSCESCPRSKRTLILLPDLIKRLSNKDNASSEKPYSKLNSYGFLVRKQCKHQHTYISFFYSPQISRKFSYFEFMADPSSWAEFLYSLGLTQIESNQYSLSRSSSSSNQKSSLLNPRLFTCILLYAKLDHNHARDKQRKI